MDINIMQAERKCAKCGELHDTGHVFNDRQVIGERTRLWEVFMCVDCLAPVLTRTEPKGE